MLVRSLKKKYLLKDGRIYWHRLYYDLMPEWTTRYSPPGGSYNYAYYFHHPWRLLKDWYYKAKWFLQRGYRGYGDNDTWGWYCHMARINVAVLRELAARKYVHPCGMTMGGWRTRLLKMADGFQSVIDDDNDFTSYKRLSRRQYLSLLRKRQTRLRNGLKLYAEHFQSLWD